MGTTRAGWKPAPCGSPSSSVSRRDATRRDRRYSQLIDMLKGGAGLRVRTARSSGKRDSQLLSLDGFEQALSDPPITLKAYKEVRGRLLREGATRHKRKKREERARKKKDEG